jgi:cob(I)alamin adenosyltransferase
MRKGLIHIYTGDGKGKTTAAVGLAVRAKSRGLRTLFVQFFKESNPSGENRAFQDIGIKTMNFDKVKSPFFNPSIDKSMLKKEVKKALIELKEILSEGIFDLIVLDEFICLIREDLISEEEAIQFVKNKPEHIELVMTGWGATEKISEIADYVTNMQKIKHPYKNKIKSRKGIEF